MEQLTVYRYVSFSLSLSLALSLCLSLSLSFSLPPILLFLSVLPPLLHRHSVSAPFFFSVSSLSLSIPLSPFSHLSLRKGLTFIPIFFFLHAAQATRIQLQADRVIENNVSEVTKPCSFLASLYLAVV